MHPSSAFPDIATEDVEVFARKNSFEVRYRFEKIPRSSQGLFQQFTAELDRVSRLTPLMLARHQVGQASRICSGVLVPQSLATKASPLITPDEGVRLRAVETKGGTVLEHTYDDIGQLSSTWYPDRRLVHRTYSDQGRLMSVTAGPNARASFQYDHGGYLTKSFYETNPSCGFRFIRDRSGRLLTAAFPSDMLRVSYNEISEIIRLEDSHSAITLDRFKGGDITQVKMSSQTGGQANFFVTSNTARVGKAPGTHDGQETFFGPLGVITLDGLSRVRSWLRWDGNRMEFKYDQHGRINKVLSAEGLSTLSYDKEGNIESVFRHDGTFFLWYKDPGQGQSMIIGPSGISLRLYDSLGRIKGLCDSWGASTSFGYGLFRTSHAPINISSPQWGRLGMKYSGTAHLRQLSMIGKGLISFEFDAGQNPERISYRAANVLHLAELCVVAGWLYATGKAGLKTYMEAFEWSYML